MLEYFSATLLGEVSKLVFTLITTLVATNILGADIYGKYIYLYSFVTIFSILCMNGFQGGSIYFAASSEYLYNKKEIWKIKRLIFSNIFLNFVVIFIILYSLKSLWLPLISDTSEPIYIYLLAVFPNSISIIYQLLNRSQNKHMLSVFGEILIYVLWLIITLISIYFGYGNNALILSMVFAQVIVILIYFIKNSDWMIFSPKISVKFWGNLHREILKFSWPLMLASMILILINHIDILMLGFYMDNRAVGIFSVALRISNTGVIILNSLNLVFGPLIRQLHQRKEYLKLSKIYKNVTKMLLASILIFYTIVYFFSSELMGIFGQDFEGEVMVLYLISFGNIINMSVGSAGLLLNMTGHPKYNLFTNIFVCVANIILNAIMIPRFGIIGAAIATAISIAMVNILRLIIIYRKEKLFPYNKKYVPMLLSFIPSIVIAYIIRYYVNTYWIIEIFLIGIPFISIYGFLYWKYALTETEITFIKDLRKRLLFKRSGN